MVKNGLLSLTQNKTNALCIASVHDIDLYLNGTLLEFTSEHRHHTCQVSRFRRESHGFGNEITVSR